MVGLAHLLLFIGPSSVLSTRLDKSVYFLLGETIHPKEYNSDIVGIIHGFNPERMNELSHALLLFIIVWQRFCEPARLRIAYCPWARPCVCVPCLVRHLRLTRMLPLGCLFVYDLVVSSSSSPYPKKICHAPPALGGACIIPTSSLQYFAAELVTCCYIFISYW